MGTSWTSTHMGKVNLIIRSKQTWKFPKKKKKTKKSWKSSLRKEKITWFWFCKSNGFFSYLWPVISGIHGLRRGKGEDGVFRERKITYFSTAAVPKAKRKTKALWDDCMYVGWFPCVGQLYDYCLCENEWVFLSFN